MEVLPESLQFENRDKGRVTRPIVAAIKARVLMEYASPLFNGNPVYSGFVNKEGVQLFPAAFDPEKWEMAAQACKEAIAICHAAVNSFFQTADFASPFHQNNTTFLNTAL